ncbi:MAG: beta-galactosidase [Armatimonadetes bacterium]|nr:beta-galactosidase [Armatimonadota bacterium]
MDRRTHPPLFRQHSGLLHGADYNPEQWPRETWADDARFMTEVKFTSASVGIFSWVSLEPAEGRFEFGWLDDVMDILARDGRFACLATPTAAMPAWMSQKYPEVLRTDPDGVRRKHGNRVNFCWTSPVFRDKVAAIDHALAERYAGHPALGCWHISNEYGGTCHCSLCEAKFRTWLQARYGSLDALNHAYWTAFWGHTYTDWSQIEIPGGKGEGSVFGLALDWKRFSSQQIIDMYCYERDILKSHTPDVPCTTNLMGTYDCVDGFAISKEMDFVAWDSYPWFSGRPDEPAAWVRTSFVHDLNRSLKDKPFLLMECTPSSSNWYPTWQLKRPNQFMLEGLQAVAHGSEGVQYFQWRQSRGSMEQFHGAVVAHNNRSDMRVFQQVKEMGELLATMPFVAGSGVPAEAAVVYDWEVAWGLETCIDFRSKRAQYEKTVVTHYRALVEQGLDVDVVDSVSDLSRYKLVVAPMLFLLRPGVAERLAAYVDQGGTLVCTYMTGWVDQSGLAFHGGAPEALRAVLGVESEEWDELYERQSNSFIWNGNTYEATTYCERVRAVGAEVLATFASDFYAGEPVLTRNNYGSGKAYFVGTRTDIGFLRDFSKQIASEVGLTPGVASEGPTSVSVRRRQGADADYIFVLNYAQEAAQVTLLQPGPYHDLQGQPVSSQIDLEPFGTRVLVRPVSG